MSLEAFEMAVITALCKSFISKIFLFSILGHLTEADPNLCWNQKLCAIPKEKPMRNHDPKELVMIGLFTLHSIVVEFKRQIQNK